MLNSGGMKTSKELVLLNFKTKDKNEILKELGKRALEKKVINEHYIKGILERENKFPTGLEFGISIAIPHIGEHCNESFISLAILDEPVVFNSMEDSEKELEVEIVFMFGITNPEEQTKILKKFIVAFRDKKNLVNLKNMKSSEAALEYLNELLDGYLTIS